jgi:hypothetical protein
MTNTKQFTTTIFGMIVEVEQLGRGATATVKNGAFAGMYRFASTKELAFEILKDDIAARLAADVCQQLTNR